MRRGRLFLGDVFVVAIAIADEVVVLATAIKKQVFKVPIKYPAIDAANDGHLVKWI